MTSSLLREMAGWASDPERLAGMFGALPNPDIILRQAGLDHEAYRRIRSDGHVMSKIVDRQAGLLSREWRVRPGGDTAGDRAAAELCTRAVERMAAHPEHPLEESLALIQDAVFLGHRALEPVWEATPDGWLPACLRDIPNRRLHHDGKQWRILTRSNPVNGIAPPPFKLLLARHMATTDNPYGEALLSRCYWPYYFKINGLQFWARAGEKHGVPWIILEGVEKERQQEAAEALHKAVLDAVVSLPDGARLRVEGLKGVSPDIHERLIRVCNAEISKILVGQTLSTEIDGQGSRAAAQTHAGLRDEIVEGDRKRVARVMERLFGWILEVNGIRAAVPGWAWIEEDKPDRDWVETAKTAIEAMPGQVPLKWAYEKFGIPVPGNLPEDAMVPAPGVAPEMAAFAAESSRFTPDQEAIEGLMDQSIREALPAWQAQRRRLAAMIRDAQSYEELSGRLADILSASDLGGMSDPLQRACLNADLFGQAAIHARTAKKDG